MTGLVVADPAEPDARIAAAALGLPPAGERSRERRGGRDDECGEGGGGAVLGRREARGAAQRGEQIDHEGADRAWVGHVQELVRHAGEQLRVELAAQANGSH
eukprot:scaffold131761_cov29-Tisochrysis_lutea.AAC.3